MKAFSLLSTRPWPLVAAVVVLLAAHGLAFYFFRHLALSATLASGLIILIFVKHLGMFGPLYALIRRQFAKTSNK
jgi:hypothetical protein